MDCLTERRRLIYWASAILIGALIIRLVAAVYWQSLLSQSGERFRFGDSDTYWVLAEKVSQGLPYEYGGVDSRAFRAPGYPLILAATIFIASGLGEQGVVFAARMVGSLLGVLTIALLMVATYQLVSSSKPRQPFVFRATLVCGILASLYLGAIGMSIFILSEAIFCPLMVLSLLAWNQASLPGEKSPVRWQLLAGAATGAACLCRPSWLLWPGLLAVICLVRWRWPNFFSNACSASENSSHDAVSEIVPFSKVLLSLFVFGFAMAAMMSAWWIRNYMVFQSFVPTTLQVGASLYDGLHDGASGASDEGMRFTLETEQELREFDRRWKEKNRASSEVQALQSEPLVPFEIRLNQVLFSKAISWAVENPYATARLALIKFAKMWTPWPTAKEIGGLSVRIVEAVGYLVIVGLAIVGFMTIYPGLRYPTIIYASPVLYFAVLHTIFVGSVRYRQPAILVLTIVSGIGAAWMLNQIEMKRKTR
ncbi:MAG: hypothetical protein NTW52_11160 [Planctomycetota bacterium]|nr:hypothetical protein [Planctomycetota bacterium]